MPKGRGPARLVSCKACQLPFLTIRFGRAAMFCHRPECDEQRERQRKEELESVRRERAKLKRQERARRKRREVIDRRMKRHRLEFFRPIQDDLEQMKLAEDILEVVALAGHIEPSRESLARAVRAAVQPQGQAELHGAYQRVAAEALALADLVRPRNVRESDLPVQTEDQPELAAAV